MPFQTNRAKAQIRVAGHILAGRGFFSNSGSFATLAAIRRGAFVAGDVDRGNLDCRSWDIPNLWICVAHHSGDRVSHGGPHQDHGGVGASSDSCSGDAQDQDVDASIDAES